MDKIDRIVDSLLPKVDKMINAMVHLSDDEDFFIKFRGNKYWLKEPGELQPKHDGSKWRVELNVPKKTFMPIKRLK